MRKFLGILGGFTCLASLVFVAAAIGDLVGGEKETAPGVLVGLLLFFTGTAASGGYLAKRNLVGIATPEEGAERSEEHKILRLAAARGGALRVAEVALHSDLSVAECQEAFDRLMHQGVAVPDSDDDGHLLYRFPGLADEHVSESSRPTGEL